MITKIKRLLSTRRAQSETPLQREQRKNIALHFELAAANKRADDAETKLARIALMETPKAAHAAKKMAAVARGVA